MHSRLGDVYMKLDKLDKALGEYHRFAPQTPLPLLLHSYSCYYYHHHCCCYDCYY